MASSWTPAWSTKHQRWYWEDRERGVSTWERPADCREALPAAPPQELPDISSKRFGLPEGWECEWDTRYQRHYYFNRKTQERTWKRPQDPVPAPSETAKPKSQGDARNPFNAPKDASATGQSRNIGVQRRGAGTEWNAEEFKKRLDQAKLTKDRNYIKSILKEVSENNYALRNQWRVPRTVLVPLETCLNSRVSGMGTDPVVTFSKMTTADALMFFCERNPSQKVVGLNFANGQHVGGGYKNGAIAQEEDLCRRMPTLYTSLYNAKREGLYPFGPCTCNDPKLPAKYSDVLWTPEVCIGRASESLGYGLLDKKQQVSVSLVAAAAPNLKFADPPEPYDKSLMQNTMKAILLAPLIKQPDTSTIVLGAWGCGAFGCDPHDIADLFLNALVSERLGRLYQEVHFAIPQFEANDPNGTIFREVFRKGNVKFKEIEM
ncbi:unnamed protein product [Durusdinium trenchii]|uniref:WW domain-containing protein n=2 Tax=Durusdinium trenchii TaxID=1381693 RepID=A0ABP0K441_9DINO